MLEIRAIMTLLYIVLSDEYSFEIIYRKIGKIFFQKIIPSFSDKAFQNFFLDDKNRVY